MSRRCVNAVERLESRTLFAAGDLDPTFGLGGRSIVDFSGFDSGEGAAVDVANGRIVAGGTVDPDGFGTDNPLPPRVGLAVLDLNGKLVTSFSGDGVETELLSVPGGVVDLVVQPDNKIVVLAGQVTGPHVLARFNANGTLDTAFGQRAVNIPTPTSVALAGNGDIIVGGGNGSVAAARYSASGAPTGQLITGINGRVFDVIVQGDGKVVLAGVLPEDASPSGTGQDSAVFRFRADLTGVDTTFGGGDGVVVLPEEGFDARASALAIDSQGRILVAAMESETNLFVYRLLRADGILDPSFDSQMAFQSSSIIVEDITVGPDGKITVSGEHVGSDHFLVRVNPNGGADASFGGDGAVTDRDDAGSVAGPFHDIQPDGRIITLNRFGGDFVVDRHRIDNTFDTGSAVLGAGGVLRVTGSDTGNDDVLVDDPDILSDQTLTVTVNGKRFFFDRPAVTRVEAFGLGGNDRIASGAQTFMPNPVLFNGGAGNDELIGGGANDTLLGLAGNDRLLGNGGDDHLDGGTGTDVQLGGSGADTIDYSFRSAVRVDLQGDADDGPAGERDTVGADVEHILGGRGNDTLTGNGLANFINGNGGDDTIRGGGGNDTLVGGLGRDRLFGESGNDFLDARDGITDLVLDGGSGFDTAKKDGSDPRTSIEQLV